MAVMLDYSGLRLSSAQLRSAHRQGVMGILRYICPPISACDWKRCSAAEARAIRAAGLELVLNWEWYESRMLEGPGAGKQDGRWAYAAARALGYPRGATIYVSCDTDTQNTAAVISYLRAFRAALGGYYQVDIYGSYTVVGACLRASVARYGWQTLAWSYGRIGACHLYQNGRYWYGRNADENTVRHPKAGGWNETVQAGKPKHAPPKPKPKPKPKPAPPKHGPRPAPKPAPKPAPTPATHTYTVRSGDNLTKIALRYHTTVAALVRLNRAKHPSLTRTRNRIDVGWKLTVPGKAAPSKAAPARVYVVEPGDTLSEIAHHFHTTVPKLVSWNKTRYPSLKRDPGLIERGWDLRVAA